MDTLIDPVCGMSVGESDLRIDEYPTVAFCGPGCRNAFLADPSAYPTDGATTTNHEMTTGGHNHDH